MGCFRKLSKTSISCPGIGQDKMLIGQGKMQYQLSLLCFVG